MCVVDDSSQCMGELPDEFRVSWRRRRRRRKKRRRIREEEAEEGPVHILQLKLHLRDGSHGLCSYYYYYYHYYYYYSPGQAAAVMSLPSVTAHEIGSGSTKVAPARTTEGLTAEGGGGGARWRG